MRRIVIIALFLLAACSRQSAPATPALPNSGTAIIATESRVLDQGRNPPVEGDTAPDFSFTLPDGTSRRLSDLRGMPVVLNFWASWCLPCVEEMPVLQRAYAEADGELIVLAVNRNESPQAIARFAANVPVTFPLIPNISGDIGDRYAVTGLPITFFIDRNGAISARHIGALNERLLTAYLEALR